MIAKAGVIFVATTIFAILSWWFTPAEKWLPREHVLQVLTEADHGPDQVPVQEADLDTKKP